MTKIVEALNSVSDWFYELYLEVHGWVYPFWLIDYICYNLSVLFSDLAWSFYYFGDWVDHAKVKLASILSWETIWSDILNYVPNLTQIRDWFSNWSANITGTVTTWWSSTQQTVQAWITTATQGLSDLRVAWDNFWKVTWPGWLSSFNSLKSAWDNFWKVTFPSLVSFTWLDTWWDSRLKEVDSLINDTVKTWFPFYDDLVELWGGIVEFFIDPFDWIQTHVIEPIVDAFNKGFDRGMKGEDKE